MPVTKYGTFSKSIGCNKINIYGKLIEPLKSNVEALWFYKKLGIEFAAVREFDGATCIVYELKTKPAGNNVYKK